MTSAVIYNNASTVPTYLGQVATGTFVPNQLHASNTFSFSRSPHYTRDDIVSLQVVLPNWYVNASMVETNGASSASWTAAIEYPAATYTQVMFSGSATGTVVAGSNLISDACAVAIPKNSKFWIRLYQSATGHILWFNQYDGDGTAQFAVGTTAVGCPDYTMGGGAGTVCTPQAGGITIPAAIIAQTSMPTVAIVGDSIAVGTGDIADSSSRQGYLCRAFGGKYACLNVAVYSDTAQNFVASHAKRAALVAYASHVIVEYGSNDVVNSRTAAQILADTTTIIGYFTGKPVAICTLTPRVTTIDAYVTVANQTVLVSEAVRLVVNAQRRNGLSVGNTLGPAFTVFDIERAAESSYLSGKWQVISGTILPGTATYTDDGVHPNRTGHLAIANAINTSMFI